MEIGASTMRPGSTQSAAFGTVYEMGPSGPRGGTPSQHASPAVPPGSFPQSRATSVSASTYGGPPPQDAPSFSPFPKLQQRPPNVPPSDDEKLQILENARVKVIASNDPEIQLTWAQDALNFVEIDAQNETRNAVDGPRPPTPRLEHDLKTEAINITSFLAEQIHPRAQFIKGMWLEFGKFGTRKDLRESYRCYARAAERGYARAEYRMGMQFETSNDIQKAIQHYNLGVGLGDAASCYRIGMMTLLGQHGQTLDHQRGLELIKFSADHADENSPQGAYIYGMLLAKELPQIPVPEYALPLDPAQAKTYVEKAAFLGFAKAQTKLGKAYEHGELNCYFDAALSLHYSNLAARQGDEDAEMAISKWFLSGQDGVFQKNEQMAYLYAQRAAKSGLPTAEFAMGYFHEVGIHCPVDIKEANRWYKKAADNGNKDAASRIEGISRSKTLSRKDHERVAMAKINGARGSVRGNRPAHLAQRAQQAQVSMPQPQGGYPGQPVPFPAAGQAIAPAGQQPYPPQGTVHAPYQGGGYPPQGQGYPSQGAGHPPGPGGYPPQGQFPPAGSNPNSRPTSARPPPGPGYGTPGPMPGPGYGSPAPGHPGAQRPPYAAGQPPRTSSMTPVGQMPQRRPAGAPQQQQQPPHAGDFGFQAPPDYSKPRPDYTNGGHRPAPTANRPDHPSRESTPVGGHGGRPPVGRPGTAGGGRPAPQQAPQMPKPAPQQQRPAAAAAAAPAKPRPAMAHGPSTFDEMGVQGHKDKEDCVGFDILEK